MSLCEQTKHDKSETLLFCTSFVDNKEHLLRYKRYLKYYFPRLSKLGADKLFLIDDGSPRRWLNKLELKIYDAEKLPDKITDQVCIIHFKNNLGRPLLTLIPGWWRSFTFSAVLAIKYNFKKLIHIESDAYVLSDKMMDWIRETSDEWTSVYTNYYFYAETNIQIIPRKRIPILYQFWKLGKEFWYKNGCADIQYIPEYVLPIRNVNKTDFKGDRWGEDWFKEDIPEDADFVCNVGAITCAKEYCDINNEKNKKFLKRIGLLKV